MRRCLDARLKAAASMVRDRVVVADIGTDHGYLVCSLVESGKCPIGYACDINPGPLMAAEKNIRLWGLESKIKTVLGNGLEKLEYLGIEDFAILGMGGDLIAEIITQRAWTRDKGIRFVLQPMTKAEHLRRALYMAGFEIEREKAVQSGRFVYSVMQVCYNGEERDVCTLFAWTGCLWHEEDLVSRLYLSRVARIVQKKADGLFISGDRAEEADFYASLAEKIRRKADVQG